jgi:pimeloyl-ACP methyl ester carboxylesterase
MSDRPPGDLESTTGGSAREHADWVGADNVNAVHANRRPGRFSTRRAIGRAVLRVAAMVVLVMLAGATYQGVSTAIERRRYQRPGGLIDVGGHQLHLYCMGSGTPAVILEAPAGGLSVAWARVQPGIARVTRACSYDRAGLGWSERGDGPYDPLDVPVQLHTLMAQANVGGPFVLVGQGLGASFATLFAAKFPADTDALVLVDPPAMPPDGSRRTAAISSASPWLARVGLLRVTGTLSSRAAGLPEPAAGALAAFLDRPDHLTNAAGELSQWDETVAAATRATLPQDLPVRRVKASGTERVAFIVTDAEAAPVVAAVVDTVRNLRAR